MIEIKNKRTSVEVENTDPQGRRLKGTIIVSQDKVSDASFAVFGTDEIDSSVTYSSHFYDDGKMSENVNGNAELIDEAKIFARETIEEFKNQK